MKTKRIFLCASLLLVGMISVKAQTLRLVTATPSSSTTIGAGSSLHVGTSAGSTSTTAAFNTFIGMNSGKVNTGSRNLFSGYNSGTANLLGSDNVFLGWNSGLVNTTGYSNTFVGSGSGKSNILGNSNSFFGTNAGSLVTGSSNSFFGAGAGGLATGKNNSLFGAGAGGSINIGEYNSIFGTGAGALITTGGYNSLFGFNAGINITTGNYNMIFGYKTGPSITTGSNNLLIGNFSGQSITTGVNNVYIGTVNNASNLSNNVFISDGSGNQKIHFDAVGNAGIGTNAGADKVTIRSALPSDSGLALVSLPNSSTVSTFNNNGKVLSVDNNGKVILVNGGASSSGTSWNIGGNANIAPDNFLGTTDDNDLRFRRNSIRAGYLTAYNTAYGVRAGENINPQVTDPNPWAQTGIKNTFIGIEAGTSSKYGVANVYIGDNSGSHETDNKVNTFVGADSGQHHNGDGNGNTFIGYDSGNDGGEFNSFLGTNSGLHSRGDNNTYLGTFCGANVQGKANTFVGNVLPATDGNGQAFLDETVIIADGSGNQRLYIDHHGNAGFGLGNDVLPSATVEIKSNNGDSGLKLSSLAGSAPNQVLSVDQDGLVVLVPSATGGNNIYNQNGTLTQDRTVTMNNNNLIFDTNSTSKIYIGNQTPSMPTATGNYKLFVEGGILTEKVKVAMRNNPTYWADYVFSNDYKVMPLREVEKYYVANKHLPNIPSSQELTKDGLDLADMQAKQMEKIEELTIYIVEQNKAIEKLQAQVKALLEKK